MSNSVFDAYLICQALGWDWNLWTMILINGIEIVMAILLGLLILVVGVWLDGR